MPKLGNKGRPSLYGERMHMTSVMLTDNHKHMLQGLCDAYRVVGASALIRLLVEHAWLVETRGSEAPSLDDYIRNVRR